MANLIQVTPDELRAKANDIRKYRAQSDEAVDRLSSLIRGLNEIWVGDAQRAFEDKIHSLQTNFNYFSDIMEKYAFLMDIAADNLEDTDRRISNAINNFSI